MNYDEKLFVNGGNFDSSSHPHLSNITQQQQQQQQPCIDPSSLLLNCTTFDNQTINWPGFVDGQDANFDTSPTDTNDSSFFDTFVLPDDLFINNGTGFLTENIPHNIQQQINWINAVDNDTSHDMKTCQNVEYNLNDTLDIIQQSPALIDAQQHQLSQTLGMEGSATVSNCDLATRKRFSNDPTSHQQIQPKRMKSSGGGTDLYSTDSFLNFSSCLMFADTSANYPSYHVSLNPAKMFSDIPLPSRRFHTSQIHHLLSLANSNPIFDPNIATSALETYILTSQSSATDPDSVIVFFTPRIGQKSYGTEKRFLSPPPMISQSNCNISSFTLSFDPTGYICHQLCGGVSSTPVDYVQTPLAHSSLNSNKANPSGYISLFKNMFVGDLLKMRERKPIPSSFISDPIISSLFSSIGTSKTKKDFEFYLRLDSSFDSSHIGTFMSDTLTLISKPSKKKIPASNTTSQLIRRGKDERNSTGSSETITNGTSIALYNRLKSQNISTRYLGIQSEQGVNIAVGKNAIWQPFIIKYADNRDFGCNRIIYDMEIFLECPVSGWKSENLIIRRVETKSQVILPSPSKIRKNDEESVFQLQKIAFQRSSNPFEYFAINHQTSEAIFIPSAKVKCSIKTDTESDESSSETTSSVLADRVAENAVWSIVSVSQVSYRFFNPRLHLSNFDIPRLPVTPIPKIVSSSFLDYVPLQDSQNFHLMNIEVTMPAHAVLETLGILVPCDGTVSLMPSTGLSNLQFDVYLGNIKCEILHISNEFISDEGEVLPVDILDGKKKYKDILSLYYLQLLLKLPSLKECIKEGGWASGLACFKNDAEDVVGELERGLGTGSLQNPVLEDWASVILGNTYLEQEQQLEEISKQGSLSNIGFPSSIGKVRSIVQNKMECGHWLQETSLDVCLPLIFVRRIDGIVYRTDSTVSFNRKLAPS